MTGMWVACTSNVASKGEIESVQHCRGNRGAASGSTNRQYISTSPAMLSAVRDMAGNPYGTARRHDPDAMSGFQPNDAAQNQDQFILAMLVHGQLHTLRDHPATEGGKRARHGFGIEISEIVGVNMVVVELEKGHGGR